MQLLRFLGVADASIMKWFGMTGEGAYLRYTELCNKMETLDVPGFASFDALLSHADARRTLDDFLDEEYLTDVAEWLSTSASEGSKGI